MNIPNTHNPEYGFFGTIARLGLNTQSIGTLRLLSLAKSLNINT
ncbi:hypothetical protein [Kingella negevensis]|nr:hypothetical protein [Kingella negevensis]MDK4687836.1 hypothetical protein [Kingella negevensis]WII91169.1 hypothetical protein QEO93_00810 [Kingella negevensis]